MQPLFVDCNGATIRIDPPKDEVGYAKVSIGSPAVWYEEVLQQPAQFVEIFMSAETVKSLSDVLAASVDFKTREILNA
jgi:hypothetical protein